MIRNEIQAQLEPVHAALRQLQARSGDVEALQRMMHQLSPLTSLLAPYAGNAPAPRGRPGRPPGRPAGRKASATAGRRGPRGANTARACAIIGCPRPARTKGYCAAHYQKLRNLKNTNRLPSSWADFAPEHSVPDVVLPRGRAASKALKEARK